MEAHMPFHRSVTLALALALLSPVQSHAQSARTAAHDTAAPLSTAAAQLLHLLDQRVDDGAVELGAKLIREHPEDAALHALYAISLREYGGFGEARRLSEEYVARWPDDPWVQVARGGMVGGLTRSKEALAAAARARQLAPDSPEIARLVMRIYWYHNAHGRAVALADSFIDSGRATAGLRVEKAWALSPISIRGARPARRDTAAAALAQRELELGLAESPPSAAAYLTAGRRLLQDRRPADALAVLERAVELSPHSNAIRQAYWQSISARTDIAADAKRPMIQSDIDAFLDVRQHAVSARRAVADYYMWWTGDTERFNLMADLIQQEHAGTWQAADLAHSRAMYEYRGLLNELAAAAAVRGEATTHADRMAAERRLRDMLRPITTMLGTNSDVLYRVYDDLFYSLAQDSTTSADELLSTFERMEEHSPWPRSAYYARHVMLPVALAERRSHLAHAEQLARAGLEVMEDELEQWGLVHLAVAEYAEQLDLVQSDYHATLGWVLFHKAEITEAKRELEKAHEILNTAATPPYRLGRIAEAEGDIAAAERWYATGRGLENRRSSDALERLYLARNESLDGFDAYLAAIDERDRARRRALVEAQRIAEPEPLPDFEHEWMKGGRFNNEALKGRIAVIHFWGVWCGPCVREAPQIQVFADRFRDDPDIIFITVANDPDPDTTRDFMEEKDYDFPVIFDEGLVRLSNIRAFPTTLFVDRDGRIVFSFRGASLRLVEEYTWRVEALLGEAVADDDAQANAQYESPAAPAAPLSAAAAQLLNLLDLRVDDEAVELGARLIREHPDDAALHALHAISLVEYAGWKESMSLTEEYVARWPEDPWVQVARGKVLFDPVFRTEALASAALARQLAPENADIAAHVIRIYATHVRHSHAVALADSFIANGRATARLRLAKASALRDMAVLPVGRDTAAAALAQRELELALMEEPPSAAAYLTAGERFLDDRRVAEAMPLLERAVELSPRSNPIRRAYWNGMRGMNASADEKQAMVRADMDAYLDARQHAVGARNEAARHLRFSGDLEGHGAIWDLIARENAGTWQAASVAMGRGDREMRSAWEQATTAADSMAANRRHRDALWQVTTMPGATSIVLGDVYGRIFRLLEQDSTTSADELVSVFEHKEEHIAYRWSTGHLTDRHVTLPVALAERRGRLDQAEQLARAGLEAREDRLEQLSENYTMAEYAERLGGATSETHATIGWVLFHKGDIAGAKRELEQAHEALNTDPTPPYRLGRIAEAEGDVETAELWYATGRGRENWDRRSSDALERIYLARNESLDGFDQYLAIIDQRDVARRRAKVESDRIAEPEPLPVFELDWMHGGRFSSESLAGKVAVINFWGVWCGPCVLEAPDIQKFAEKFRDDPDVVFITVANDRDPDTTRGFMKEKGFDFPVIFDEGLVGMVNLRGFPTTLFVDREGRIVFSYLGASLLLVDEYTWRVEALLGRTVADSDAQVRSASPLKPATLSPAAAQLLHLLEMRVDDEAVDLGAKLILEHPDDAALHALYAISLRQYWGWQEAIRLSEEYVARWPHDPWVHVARGAALSRHGSAFGSRTEEALAAAARARQLAPEDAEIARYVMSIYSAHNRHGHAVALADSFTAAGRSTTGLRVGKALALWDMIGLSGRRDTAATVLARRELESALAETAPSAAAYLLAADRFLSFAGDRRVADALPLLERAVRLSPRSIAIRQAYWRGLTARTDITADEKRRLVHADMDAFLDARQHAVGAALAVAESMDREQSGPMMDRVQREHHGTWQAARAAYWRAQMSRDTGYRQGATLADSMAADRGYLAVLRLITTMPGANSFVLSSVYSQIFWTLQRDSTASADELIAAFDSHREHAAWPNPSSRHVTLPVALAERGSRLDLAEQLARDGLEPMEDNLEWWHYYGTVAEYAEQLDRVRSNYHATLGWVLFHKGDLAEARRELEQAHEVLNTAATPPYRLGRIAEAEGDIEAAERWYATGRGREDWDRRSSEALERLYLSRNASLDGFDGYLAAIDERDMARRRAKVETDRIAEPVPLPAFEHDWMNGGRFSSGSLAGKVAVINFWGVWCGPCVREAPEIQAFAEKFRDHPDVVFITVANDIDLDVTRDFMKAKGYDFPVIFDEGLVGMVNPRAFPTTLFVDRDGRIVFSYLGASLRLVEEYTWRVEALLGRTVAGSDAQAQR
jgi:thiol-disulfide isomerase/thioredoxin/Flp pilus assembly protein TadD